MTTAKPAEKKKCQACQDKLWIRLVPGIQSKSMAAPCLACSSHRKLDDIERERGIQIQRDEYGVHQEYLVPVDSSSLNPLDDALNALLEIARLPAWQQSDAGSIARRTLNKLGFRHAETEPCDVMNPGET